MPSLPEASPTSWSRRRELRIRRAIRSNLSDWARHALTPLGQAPAAHHLLLIEALEAVEAGRCDRLMVLMPPGSAKSTYASVLFPAWWFARRPASSVIACAHTADLAKDFGRRVRNLADEYALQLGYSLSHDARAAGRWVTSGGGSYFASGIDGPIVGRRADLVLIDDPIRGYADADSATMRDHLWRWYCSDLLTRLKPGGRVVLVMTRWHDDDLGGRLLASGEAWRCLRLPALAEADDPLGRAPGAALWPDWEDEVALGRKRTLLGERSWMALFQQAPMKLTGMLFKTLTMTLIDAVPHNLGELVRAWDLAATAEISNSDGDWTVGLKLGREPGGRFVIVDVIRLRGGPYEVERAILGAAHQDGPHVAVSLPQDPGQAGRAQVQYLTRQLAGFRVVSSAETGSKATRAMPVASQINAGNVALVRGAWNRALLDELQDFPHGRKDDQVDALSRAFAEMTARPAAARQINMSLLSR